MEKIKVGIIGTGFIGPAHIEALRRLGFVEVVALAEVDQSTAEKKATQLNIPNAYGDYRRLLDDKDIIAVHNCTPNNLHYRINSDIIKSGKHCISEKPLSITSQEAKELVEQANKSKLVCAVDYNYRFYPLALQIREMITNDELGDIYLVHGSYLQDWLFYDSDYNWRVDAKVGGTSRAVADIGTHWCDLVQFVTGLKITKVLADFKTIHKIRKRPKGEVETFAGKELKPEDYESIKIDTEDYASVLLEFNTGAKGCFTVSQVSAGRKNRLYFEIDGSKKAVAFDQENAEQLWIGYRERANEIMLRDASLMDKKIRHYVHYPGGHPEGYPDGLTNFMRNVYEFITGVKKMGKDKPEFATFEDACYEVVLCEAIQESNKKQMWVEVKA